VNRSVPVGCGPNVDQAGYERTAVAASANTVRYLPVLSPPLVAVGPLHGAWFGPFLLSARLKSIYDLAFLPLFRDVRSQAEQPAEEAAQADRPCSPEASSPSVGRCERCTVTAGTGESWRPA
jgi:hypothetical protein